MLQKIGSLSGGERNRTALARLAAMDLNVLILDEPTNHLDLWARDSLEKALKEFDGTVIFVSHDRYFLNQVVDRLLVVEPNRFRTIDGNYETYLHFIRQGLAADARSDVAVKTKSGSPAETKTDTRPEKERRKRKYPYKKATEVEADIHRCEAKIADLHEQMTLPEVLRDGLRVKQIAAEIAEQETLLPRLYEHWEEATELNS